VEGLRKEPWLARTKLVTLALGLLEACSRSTPEDPDLEILLGGAAGRATSGGMSATDGKGDGGAAGRTVVEVGGRVGARQTGGSSGQADAGNAAGGVLPDLPDPEGSVAVAYQIDAAHTGAQLKAKLRLPLARRWSRDLGSTGISYPLVANGRVFITVDTQLFALDARDGALAWGPLELGGALSTTSERCSAARTPCILKWSNATYERGRIYAVNREGTLYAIDALTGDVVWSIKLPGDYDVHSAPTVLNGHIYTSRSSSTLYAVRATDGQVLWSAMVENGWQSSPAVSSDTVYACYLCNNTYAIATLSGKQLWYHRGSCTGGGGGLTAVLADGRLYTRGPDGNWILDAASGTVLDLYQAGPAPAVAGEIVFAVNDGVLNAWRAGDRRSLWRFGDGSITSAPIVAGSIVIAGNSAGELFALDMRNGTVISSIDLPYPVPLSNEQVEDAPLTGLAVAGDQLYVPAGSELFAY
jgi:outer membrane protein assembly factor BamB